MNQQNLEELERIRIESERMKIVPDPRYCEEVVENFERDSLKRKANE